MRVLALVVVVSTGACLLKPDRPTGVPVDAGGDAIDAPSDGTPSMIEQVEQTSGTAIPSAGQVAIPPPAMAEDGDFVLLMLDRWASTTPVLTTNGWQQINVLLVDGDCQEVAYRIAGPGESMNAGPYSFDANDQAKWMMTVYRRATSVPSGFATQVLGVDNSMGRYVFTLRDPAPSTGSGLLVDALALAYDDPGCMSSAPLVQTDFWKMFQRTVTTGEDLGPLSLSCARQEGAAFQFRIQ